MPSRKVGEFSLGGDFWESVHTLKGILSEQKSAPWRETSLWKVPKLTFNWGNWWFWNRSLQWSLWLPRWPFDEWLSWNWIGWFCLLLQQHQPSFLSWPLAVNRYWAVLSAHQKNREGFSFFSLQSVQRTNPLGFKWGVSDFSSHCSDLSKMTLFVMARGSGVILRSNLWLRIPYFPRSLQ